MRHRPGISKYLQCTGSLTVLCYMHWLTSPTLTKSVNWCLLSWHFQASLQAPCLQESNMNTHWGVQALPMVARVRAGERGAPGASRRRGRREAPQRGAGGRGGRGGCCGRERRARRGRAVRAARGSAVRAGERRARLVLAALAARGAAVRVAETPERRGRPRGAGGRGGANLTCATRAVGIGAAAGVYAEKGGAGGARAPKAVVFGGLFAAETLGCKTPAGWRRPR